VVGRRGRPSPTSRGRQRYEEALGETGEAPADVLRKADRAAALLTRLVKAFS
jgi:hypothetical protein